MEIAIHEPMYPSWVPRNTCPACAQGTSKTNPFHSCHGVQVPIQTWTPSPHTWDPILVWCLDLHLSPPPISRSGKSRNPRQEHNEPSHSHKQVCAQDNKVCDRTIIHSNGRSLIDTNRDNSVTKLNPIGRGTQPVTPTNTYTISLSGLHFSFHSFYHESNYNNHLLWVTTGYSRYQKPKHNSYSNLH